MSITNVSTLAELASTSLATYATLNRNELKASLEAANIGANFMSIQADNFVSRYELLDQRPNVDRTGFSAAVFLDKVTNRKVLAIRGTEMEQGLPQIISDLALADIVGIGGGGYASTQASDLYRYFKQLSTPSGQAVQYSEAELNRLFLLGHPGLSGAAVTAGLATFRDDAANDRGIDSGVPGQAVIGPNDLIDVTGHSLGGHLAMLLARMFPTRVNEVVTLNAPTFFTQGDIYLSLLGFPPLGGGNITRLEADGDAIHLLGNVDPGTVIPTAQENFTSLDSLGGVFAPIASNHSSVNGVDALNLMALMARLDTGFANDTVGLSNIVRGASNTAADTYEATLDSLRWLLLGRGQSATPISAGASDAARRHLYENMSALLASQAFRDLEGRVRIDLSSADLRAKARNDFSALASLITLSPVVITATTAANQVELDAVLRAAWGSPYAAWQDDKSLSQAERDAGKATFTDAYLAARAEMLTWMQQFNTRDIAYTQRLNSLGGLFPTPVQGDFIYQDVARGISLDIDGFNPTEPGSHYVRFGGEQTDVLIGGTLSDRLFGGGGTDQINAGDGNDYVEGGAEFDSLYGERGNDTLIGGAGGDWLEGGEGNDQLKGGQGIDTYRFGTGWGHDIIEDGDGQGVINVEGIGPITGAGASKVAEGVWQTADQRITYTLVSTDGTRNDLYITFSDRPDVITIRNWSTEQNVGINSLPTTVTPPASVNPMTGDIAKETNDEGDYYNGNSHGYVSAGAQADAADILIGTTGADSILGLGGNDGLAGADGNDFIDGGAGSDLIFGGTGVDTLNGGSGDDFIFGSAVGSISMPFNVNFTMPSIGSSVEVARGFSWIATRADGPRYDGQTSWMRYIGVFGADQSPLFMGNDGRYYVEASGNVIDGGAGNDYIAAGTDDDTVHGGVGDDDLVGMWGDDVMFGDEGDDYLWGDSTNDPTSPEYTDPEHDGNDFLVGGAGNDVLTGQGGGDELYGGTGNDKLWGDGAVEYTPFAVHGADYLDGGDGDDELVGGGRDDTLVGGAGADNLKGDGGTNDTIAGEFHGADLLEGGAGNDGLTGGGRDDTLEGGDGDDRLWGDDSNNNRISVAIHGNDYLDGGAGADYMEAGGGDDEVYGGDGNDSMMGDADATRSDVVGNDYLDGEAGNDTIFGGGGQDTMFGGLGADRLFGDLGEDAGADGNDYIDGEEGDDAVVGNGGRDTLYGSAGDDTLWGDGTQAGVEAASDGADVLEGGEGNDMLFGQGGNDTIAGGEGNDSMNGGSGEDQLDGGNGNDTLFGQAGSDSLGGGDGNDYLDGGGETDQLIGGMGSDTLYGQDGSDALEGGEGNDYLDGGAGGDQLSGGAGSDALFGGVGDDVLNGGAGADGLYGGLGNDTLISDGLDYLDGGAGDDTYVITTQPPQLINGTLTYSVPLINDFQGANTIVVNGTTVEASSLRMYSQGGTTYLSFGDGGGVAMGPDVNLNALQIRDSTGGLHALGSLSGVDPVTGRVQSGIWVEGTGLQSTQTIQVGQSIQGSGVAEDVLGGSGDDRLDAGAGNDFVAGNAGDDELIGGDGADTLTGGVGNDTYRGGRADGADVAADVYRFNLGDGTDWIELTPAAEGQRDVIEFGAGITLDDLEITNELQDISDTQVQIVIRYGESDTITLSAGGEGGIEEIRFADGTTVSMAALMNMIPPRAIDPTRLTGTTSDDVLDGTEGDDRLAGGYGNDTLIGDEGRDWLIGGAGSNIYRFSNTSGNDLISYSAGESATLEFAGVAPGTVTARLEGDDLVIAYGDDNFVRISDYAFAPQLANSWRAQFDSLPSLTLGQLLQSNPAVQAANLAQRQEQFLGQQLWQLGSTAQRHSPYGAEGPPGVIPNAVQQVDRTVNAGQTFEFNNYLQAVDSTSTRTVRESSPVYQDQPVVGFGGSNGASSAGAYVPIPLNNGGYIDLPPGAVPIYRNNPGGNGSGGGSGSGGYDEFLGYFLPTGPAGPSSSPGIQIVGWQSYTYTYTVVTADDAAIQTRLTGTAGDDVVIPGPQDSQYPVLFRGSVDTGAGNDLIYLGSGQNGAYAGPLSRYQDWQRMPVANYVFQVSTFLNRGLGAWVDAGSGNDVVAGTDGNDFIIGGTGSDILDGQAGADTYYIGVNGNDVDRIADLAEFDWASNGETMFIAYGGDLRHPNRDTVEFDDSVSIDQLSYRWRITSSEGPDYATLEFFHQGQLFLQVDYRASAMQGTGPSQITDADLLQYLREISGLSASEIQQRGASMAGAELFKFSDGTVLSVAALLSQLPRLPDNTSALPPSVQSPLEDLSATEDAPFHAWLADGFRDPQGQALSFDARLLNGAPLPDWMQFDPSTGYLSGTPENDQVGTLEIVVTATNESGQTTSDTFNLTVANVNDAPEFVGGSLDPVVVDAGTNFSRTIDWFQDPDVGDTLTLSAALTSGDALPSWIQFNAGTRSLSAFPPAGILGETTIRVTATDGAGASVTRDLVIDVQAGTPPGAFFAGGAGNDTLQGGAGNDTLSAGAGDDVLEGGAGADHLFAGEEGNNRFLFGRGDGQDRVHFDGSTAGGTNTLQLKAGVNPGDVILRRVQDTDLGDTFGALEVSIAGTTDTISFNVFFFNDSPQNEFNTLHQIRFADGTVWDLDAIVERVFSGATGNDTLFGLRVADVIDGGGGDDVLWGRAGNDTLRGGSGDDTLQGESGDDTLDGGAGADHLFAGEESNNTFLFGRGDGQDRVHFDGLTAGGTNTLQFKADVNPWDVVLRRVQDTDLGDTFGALEVSIAGTADTISFNVFFFNDSPQNEFNTLHQIRFADGTVWDLDAIVERVFSGSAGNDTLFGLRGADVIDGGDGDDVLWGRAGNDTLRGGAGDDTLRGESGDDVLDGGAGADHLFAGGESNNIILFGRGDGQDRIHFDGSTAGDTNTLQFKAGVNPGDVVLRRVQDTDLGDTFGALEVSIAGTTDTITFNVFFFNGTAQNEFNTLHQIGFADGTIWDLDAILERAFIGTSGNDTLIGLAGADVMSGGPGNDTLQGGSGNDTLSGGLDEDVLQGGSGADTYLFSRGDGQDSVQDYDSIAGVVDSVQFGLSIMPTDLTYARVGNSLEAAIDGTTDKLIIQDWYLGTEFHVEEFHFNDGTMLTDSEVQGLVSAMAGFATPAMSGPMSGDTWRGIQPVVLVANSIA